MHLIVGLGNPGPKYEANRHNAGFLVLDALAHHLGVGGFSEKFSGLYAKARLGDAPMVLLKPQTFMNRSGESVQKAMSFFKIPLAQVVVVHDELDLAFEDLRIKVGGGLAGHNGLRSITQSCGGQDFIRLRFGISRPVHGPVDRYVLSDFSSDQEPRLLDCVDRAAEMVQAIVKDGAREAMSRFHGEAGRAKR